VGACNSNFIEVHDFPMLSYLNLTIRWPATLKFGRYGLVVTFDNYKNSQALLWSYFCSDLLFSLLVMLSIFLYVSVYHYFVKQ
jgi:hypothetical protein